MTAGMTDREITALMRGRRPRIPHSDEPRVFSIRTGENLKRATDRLKACVVICELEIHRCKIKETAKALGIGRCGLYKVIRDLTRKGLIEWTERY